VQTILDILAKDDTEVGPTLCPPARLRIFVSSFLSTLLLSFQASSTGPQTVQDLRKMLQKFERIVQKNYEARAKYADDPER
jgi:hypothetical protein